MATFEVVHNTNGSQYTQLPLLKPQCSGMPKRYDATRPVVIQNMSHHRILELGNKLHRGTLERYEHDKIQAMKAIEEAVWTKAEIMKQETVEKALKKAKALHDRELKKLTKSHDRILKDQLIRLEQEMERKSLEELKKQREESDKLLKETVEELEKIRLQEKLAAVDSARTEEITKAADKLHKVVSEYKAQLDNAKAESDKVKDKALQELSIKLGAEKEAAVEEARSAEQRDSEKRLAHQKDLYDQSIQVLHTHIADKKSEINQLHQEIESTIKQREKVITELMDTRSSYQHFINRVRPFEEGKSEYIMPPLRSVTII